MSTQISKLVILESPSKIRTVGKFLGWDYKIIASCGHIRGLPEGRMAVSVKDNYRPEFIIDSEKHDIVENLKAAVRTASEIYLATDPDREGEGIAWHICEVLEIPFKSVKRAALGEITEESVKSTFSNPTSLDLNQVNAYLARRVVDRLIGYTVSPWLNRMLKIERPARSSAGRVQSPALRLLCDREKEIEQFVAITYWTIDAEFKPKNSDASLNASLFRIVPANVIKVESRQDLPAFYLTSGDLADRIVDDLQSRLYKVADVRTEMETRPPPAPFTTSSLIKEAAEKLGLEPSQTMAVAQQLYEGPSPENITKEQCQLYELIWKQFVASQMSPATSRVTTVTVKTNKKSIKAGNEYPSINIYYFMTKTAITVFEGFTKIYDEKGLQSDPIPTLSINEPLDLLEVQANKKKTAPPQRYTKASLIDDLKKLGIGRPSTYAVIIDSIESHGHTREMIQNEEKTVLVPTEVGKMIIDQLAEGYRNIIDYTYTRRMEENLDRIANGNLEWTEFVEREYTGWIVQEISKYCRTCGAPMQLWNRGRGLFWGCTRYPQCRERESYNGPSKPSSGGHRITVCKSCKKKVEKNWNFCPYCTKKLQQSN
jgi:DNA topoisomerase-1